MKNHIKILGTTYKIIEKNKLEYKKDIGIFYPNTKIIYIKKNRSRKYKEKILTHEILHLFLCETALDDFFKKKKIKEEPFVNKLEEIFWNFLKNNTDFFE